MTVSELEKYTTISGQMTDNAECELTVLDLIADWRLMREFIMDQYRAPNVLAALKLKP